MERSAGGREATCGLDHECPPAVALTGIVSTGACDHLRELWDGLPPRGERDESEHQVGRVEAGVEDAVALSLHEPVDLLPVVRRAVGNVGGRTPGQTLPLQQTSQLRVR